MKRIKILFLVVLSILTLCCVSACGGSSGFGQSSTTKIEISLNLSKADVSVGGRVTLKATVVGSSADVVWSSSDESVATVNRGIVYGVSNGSAVITATVGKVQQSCIVNVSGESIGSGLSEIPIFYFELSAETIWVNYSFEPTATLKLSGKDVNVDISFVSSNTAVAKIEAGRIIGVSEGIAIITASCQYNGELYQKTATIEVVANN